MVMNYVGLTGIGLLIGGSLLLLVEPLTGTWLIIVGIMFLVLSVFVISITVKD